MPIVLDPTVTARLSSLLLDLAASEFTNHGCNELHLRNTPENREFVEALLKWNADKSMTLELTPDSQFIKTNDWIMMRFLSVYFDQEAKGAPARV